MKVEFQRKKEKLAHTVLTTFALIYFQNNLTLWSQELSQDSPKLCDNSQLCWKCVITAAYSFLRQPKSTVNVPCHGVLEL